MESVIIVGNAGTLLATTAKRASDGAGRVLIVGPVGRCY